MVSNHRVSVYVFLIISVVCFIFRFKRGELYLSLVSPHKAFALPTQSETSNAEPTPICIIDT